MNSLIIHNDNITDIEQFNLEKKFEQNYSDVDKYISLDIIPYIKDKPIDIIYIKDNLSKNYLELYGLRVAYHIRLSSNLSYEQRCLPVVIISDIDVYVLNKLSTLASILFTKNIFLVENVLNIVKEFDTTKIVNFKENEFKKKFLDLISIEQPNDYASHHSITNEWSIFKWSEFLKVDSDSVKRNREKISSMLYFKYLLARNPITKIKGLTFAPKSPKLNGNILYIDDQWNQGWADILDKYFSKSPTINFDTFEYDYKDKNSDIVLNDIKNEAISKKPDLVILDLRLLHKDHNHIKDDRDIECLTGIKVLNMIKSINKGIQVIMFTASNQTLILEKLYSYGILGYVKKEHPKDISVSTKDNFTKLKNLIDDGLDKIYLQEIWKIQNNILNLSVFKNSSNEKIKNIAFEINTIFEILDSKMQDKFNFVIFTYTKILETVSSIYINEFQMKYIDDNTDVGIYDSKQNKVFDYENEKWYKNTQNRLHNILYEKLNITQKSIHSDLCELINCRNYIAHPNEKIPVGCNLIKEPTSEYIVKWFTIVYEVFSQMKIEK